MSDGKYYFAREGAKVFLKLTGTLKYTISSKFDAFLDRLFSENGNIEDVIIDLSEAVFLDSTNLGFLAKISEYITEKTGRKVTIYSPCKEINMLLESVGFDEVFVIVTDTDADRASEALLEEISSDLKEERQRSHMMLDTHRALMKISEKNSDIFRNVVELLEQSVKKKDQDSKKQAPGWIPPGVQER